MTEKKESQRIGVPPDKAQAELPAKTDPAEKKMRRVRKKRAPENEFGSEAKSPKLTIPASSSSDDEDVLSIDSKKTVESEADKEKNTLLDLMESLRSRRVLKGVIQGVETGRNGEPRAVVYRDEFKVLIPASVCIERPEDFRGMKPNDVLKYQLMKRMGAEIDYVVKGMDPETGMVVASRMEAMDIRRRQIYFGKDKDGNSLMYEGRVAEARIICVIRTGVFVELFGLECFIPLKELSYKRMADAMQHYAPGQRIQVKVMKLERPDPDHIKAELSAKQTTTNPYEKVLKKHTVGNHYVGTVVVIHLGGIWVNLDSGLDCLCNFPVHGRPPMGARVTVKLKHINEETGKLIGEIVYSSNVQ